MSISIRKLIQKPGSPDLALQQATIPESVMARVAHVNRLSKDVFDIVNYTIDLDVASLVKVRSKKGIVEILNADANNTTINIDLENNEVIADNTKFYIQLSVLCSENTTVIPHAHVTYIGGISGLTIGIQINNLLPAADWGTLILYYELVKIE